MKWAWSASTVRAQRRSTVTPSGQRACVRGLFALALGGGLLLATAPVASAVGDDAYVIADVQCDSNANGVLDLTMVNERPSTEATFVVTDAASSRTSSFTVAPGEAAAITFTDLGDGLVAVPVSIDGVAGSVAATVSCDPALSTPVQVEVRAPSAGVSAASSVLPSTGSSTGGLVIGSGLVLAGIAVSLVARRRYS